MTADETAGAENLSRRMEQAKKELRALEQSMQAEGIDAPVLQDFRQALDHIRLTAWAVQKWIELKGQNRDTGSVLSLLTGERIRRATQLNTELEAHLDPAEATMQTDGLAELFQSVERLLERLAPQFKQDWEWRPKTGAS
jgi:hypothetical protein